MRSSKKKKKRSQPGWKPVANEVPGEEDEERRALDVLMEAFSSASLEDVVSAYRKAKGDANRAAEVLAGLEDEEEDRVKSSSSSICSNGISNSIAGSSSVSDSCSASSLSEGFMEKEASVKGRGVRKPKKVVAATGMVSTVMGKDYVTTRRKGCSPKQEYCDERLNKEDMEQFLCSMLGNETELSMGVVRDVLCHCGYDIEKSLDALLKLSPQTYEHSVNGQCFNHITDSDEDTELLNDFNYGLFLDGMSDSASHSSESDRDKLHSMAYHCRNYADVVASSKACSWTEPKIDKSDLSQEVLDSLFNIPKSSEHDPNLMNWRDVVTKMESLGHQANCCPISDSWLNNYAKGKDYHIFRKDAKQHWESMRASYRRAATAYSNGDRHSAAYHSEQGKLHNKMAREADEKASEEIYRARNKSIENVITIDLHGQHVKQAMRLLKVHLLFGTYVHSIQFLRVITGCGTHGVGKSKVKESVINLLETEGIKWKEENPGSVLIKVDGLKQLSFIDSEDDSI